MTNYWLLAAGAVALLVILAREAWRRIVIRKALSLSPELVALLTTYELTTLRNGLDTYLTTPVGSALAEDPRVLERQALFASIQKQRDDAAVDARRKHALKTAGLPELPGTGPAS